MPEDRGTKFQDDEQRLHNAGPSSLSPATQVFQGQIQKVKEAYGIRKWKFQATALCVNEQFSNEGLPHRLKRRKKQNNNKIK